MFEKMNIFSKPSLKILCFLGRRYREEYHMRELVRKLEIGLGSASKYLNMLEQECLVTKEEKGKLSIYKANMENPLLKELKVIFTMLEIDEMVNDLMTISNQIILFGSCADGEDSDKSDIDLFILSDKMKHVNKKINQHQVNITRRISPIIVDDAELRTMRENDKPFYSRIKKGKILYETSI